MFNHCLVTNSICAPSRAVVLTGKYSHLNGQLTNKNVFDGSQQTVPKLLKKEGYQTAIVGKWHLKSTPTGFDHFEVLKGQGQYYNPMLFTNGKNTNHTGYTTDVITDQALTWPGKCLICDYIRSVSGMVGIFPIGKKHWVVVLPLSFQNLEMIESCGS